MVATPIAACLLPKQYRDLIVGDVLEERNARWAAPHGLRVWLWTQGTLLLTGVAAWRQILFQGIRRPRLPSHKGDHMGSMKSDVRYAVRSLRRAPGFCIVAVVTLSLGIGGLTAMYSLLYGTLIRPLAYDRANELVVLRTIRPDASFPALSMPDIQDIRAAQTGLADLAVWQPWQVTITLSDAAPTRTYAASVDSRFFSILGVAPALGRFFTPDDAQPGHEPVIVLSHGFWRSLGGTSDIIGTILDLDGESYTIVGVTPSRFSDPLGTSFAFTQPPFWRASPPAFATENRSWRNFWTIGRLAQGVGLEQAHRSLANVASALAAAWPNTNAELTFGATSLREHLVGTNRSTIILLSATVLLVLIIACANVANLQITRGTMRASEHSLRRALGAGRLRIIRPLVFEHALLAGAALLGGVAVGLAVNVWMMPHVTQLDALVDLRIDVPVLLGATIMSFAIAMVFGVVPAWRTGGIPDTSARTIGAPGARLRSTLVITELTLAVALLIGAGLLVRTANRMTQVDLGISTDGVLAMNLTPSVARYATAATLDQVVEEIVGRIGQLPVVEAAGTISDRPITSASNTGWITRPDRPLAAGVASPSALYRTVAGNYFAAVGMTLLAGRLFDAGDDGSVGAVVIVNQATVDVLFPDEPPLGRMVQMMGQPREIVGVVSNVREQGPVEAAPMAAYVPFRQEAQEWATRTSTLLVRLAGEDPMEHATLIQRTVLEVAPFTAVNDVGSMDEVAALTTRPARFRAMLLSVFATVALALSAVGLGGVVTYQVAQRRREMGLRMALGATHRGILHLVVHEGLTLSLWGVFGGLVLAALGGRLMARVLFGVAPMDPLVFLSVPAVFVGVTFIAVAIPAMKAAQLHPAEALRE